MISSSQLNDTTNLKSFESETLALFSPISIFYEKELGKIRTSKAHPSLIEDIKIVTYNNQKGTLLKHIALINVSDSTTLLIQPFDNANINDIEKSLSQSEIGLNPKNDGKCIKINLPPMSKERRAEFIKIAAKKKEESIIQARKIRQDILNEIKKAEKDKKLSQDYSQKLQKNLQLSFDKINAQIENQYKKKEISLQE